MGHEEGSTDLAAVRVQTTVEYVVVQVDVVDVHCTVEGQGYHLWYLLDVNVARDSGSIGGTVTVGKHTLGRVTVWRAVRVSFDRW